MSSRLTSHRQGADLKDYARRVEDELRQVEKASIQDCDDVRCVAAHPEDIDESKNFIELHSQIQQCEGSNRRHRRPIPPPPPPPDPPLPSHLPPDPQVLQRIEGVLTGFRDDLSSMSKQIQGLQTLSEKTGIKLRNRKVACVDVSLKRFRSWSRSWPISLTASPSRRSSLSTPPLLDAMMAVLLIRQRHLRSPHQRGLF
jgi:hypothetical protein